MSKIFLESKSKKTFLLATVLLVAYFIVSASLAHGMASLETSGPPSINTEDLKDSLADLEKVRGMEKTDENIEKERVIRQRALFEIIRISLVENSQMLSFVSSLENSNEGVFLEIEKILEVDNKKYEGFILEINLSTSSDALKDLAKEIKAYRQNDNGLAIRRIIGLVLSLEKLKSIQIAKQESKEIYEKLESAENMKDGLVRVQLLAVNNELDTAHQLVISSQLRLQEMRTFDDFSFIGDWLNRANNSIDIAYSILEQTLLTIND